MTVEVLDSQVDFVDVLLTAIFLVVVTLVAVGVYKSMERPRLVVSATEAGPRARPVDVTKYVISVPFLVLGWYGFFSFILFLAPGHPSPGTLLVMPLALIVAVRFLAHVITEGAYQLSSIVPMAIVAMILLGEGLPDDAEVDQTLRELENVHLDWSAIFAVLVLEYAFTATWYWLRARKGHISTGSEFLSARHPKESSLIPVTPDPSDLRSPETRGSAAAQLDDPTGR